MQLLFILCLGICLSVSCSTRSESPQSNAMNVTNQNPIEVQTDTATFGAGCFWCVEACFLEIDGVVSVVSGYTGGKTNNPTYEDICSGSTGHAEVCQVVYDPQKVSYETLLEIFWTAHDPTTLNRQGNDKGTQYRSAIFYHNDNQQIIAQKSKKALTEAKVFDSPIVTEITALGVFYVAENYHQNYYANNSSQPYCSYVVRPKVEKVRKVFKERLKKSKN